MITFRGSQYYYRVVDALLSLQRSVPVASKAFSDAIHEGHRLGLKTLSFKATADCIKPNFNVYGELAYFVMYAGQKDIKRQARRCSNLT